MTTHYTDEKGAQIIISLLKQYGVRKIVASPGTTNLVLVASMQSDPYFEMYSSVDERSAAYIACGLAAESGEPVALSCTGATASRNYMSGLTEAYYRKLPIIALTATQSVARIGQHVPQVIDRSVLANDITRYSATLPYVKDEEDIWDCEVKVNKALLECRRNGGGPVHLNLQTKYSPDYSVKELPKYRKIDRVTLADKFPELPKGKVAIFIGSHAKMSDEQISAIDNFCASHDAVAFCDHTSSYNGRYAVNFSVVSGQVNLDVRKTYSPDLLIHIGEVSGDYYSMGIVGQAKVWRVNPDGEVRDTFRKLTSVFEMPIEFFFNHYSQPNESNNSYLLLCQDAISQIRASIPELPFSNVWIAQRIAHLIPDGSVVHLGILNSLRSWNFFDLPKSVYSMSNVGGFGIDGCTSSLIGASLHNREKLYYLITGDLAFFYDMNVVGNRHVGNNIRILLVNNGKGTEFRNFGHPAARFGEDADAYMAASGHYGNKSPELVKCYAEGLGYEYLTASSKEEFDKVYSRFLTPTVTDKPMIFEIFTNNEEESDALKTIRSIEADTTSIVKKAVKGIIGREGISAIKKIVKK
ncbi:MAG: thiamine pyrophosphate-binding protein [Rikenellaceae bacterium]